MTELPNSRPEGETVPHRPSPIIAVSGDVGSGKSAVSDSVASQLEMRRISMGDLHRAMASQSGMSTLEFNKRAETDQQIDHDVDGALRELASTSDPTVVDSRLAWWFIPSSFKVHLVVDPWIAAGRVVARGHTPTEAYRSQKEALDAAQRRNESEASRFRTLYGVAIGRLRNYDLVIDTSDASIDEVANVIISTHREHLLGSASDGPTLWVAPRRVLPTERISIVGRSFSEPLEPPNAGDLIDVGYSNGTFFVLSRHVLLSTYIRLGHRLAPAILVAEDNERLVGGGNVSANEYYKSNCTSTKLFDWQDVHGLDAGNDVV